MLTTALALIGVVGLGTMFSLVNYGYSLGRLRFFIRPGRRRTVRVVINTAISEAAKITTRRDKQILFGNLESAFYVVKAWSGFREKSKIVPSLSDDENIDYGDGHLVILGGTLRGQLGHAFLHKISEYYGLDIRFEEDNEDDNFIKVGTNEFHLNWTEQSRRGLSEDFALVVVCHNPFSLRDQRRAIFVGGFTPLATLFASRWVFEMMPKKYPHGILSSLRKRHELAVLHYEAMSGEIMSEQVLLHSSLNRLGMS